MSTRLKINSLGTLYLFLCFFSLSVLHADEIDPYSYYPDSENCHSFSEIDQEFLIHEVLNTSQLHPLLVWNYKYDLALCAVFQNEAPYLKEWIEFYKLLGVQHFYLFNNESSDNCREILEPYIKAKLVDLIDWPYVETGTRKWFNTQFKGYERGIQMAKGVAKWLILVDLDEFMYPLQDDNLLDFLRNYEPYAGVMVNWQMFGTSHVKQIPENTLMIESLVLQSDPSYHLNLNAKSIVRPEKIISCTNAHFMNYMPGWFQVNPDKVKFSGQTAPYISVDKIKINHYWSRDEEYFYLVKVPRHASWDENKELCEQLVSEFNQIENYDIQRFVPALRQNMGLD